VAQGAPEVAISDTSLEITAFAVSLLLVFRWEIWQSQGFLPALEHTAPCVYPCGVATGLYTFAVSLLLVSRWAACYGCVHLDVCQSNSRPSNAGDFLQKPLRERIWVAAVCIGCCAWEGLISDRAVRGSSVAAAGIPGGPPVVLT
jgi:hypothetical protein